MARNWTNKIMRLRKDARVLYFAARHPRTPWYAKAVMLMVAAYAISPIDLIPDFIPFAGYLDDLVIIPAGVYLAMRLVPKDILEEARQATVVPSKGIKKWGIVAAVAIVGLLLVITFGVVLLIRAMM